MSSTHARRPRFERAPVRRMVLTSRDIELLRAVHRHRFLRSTHLVALADGSRQAVLRRLQLLFHHGYVERPVFQLDWYTGGSQPLVYALGKRGAKAIAAAGWRSGVCLDSKNRSLSRVFLHHTLAVADVMVAFEVACRERPDLDFIRAEEVLARAPAATRPLRSPLRWQVDVRLDARPQHLAIEPDAIFGLRLKGEFGNPREAFFFLEADRGTMPVARKSLTQTSFARKLMAYRETWRQGVHKARFGIPGFRVLAVTASSERLGHLVAACRSLPSSGARLFLFAHVSQIREANVLAMRWVDGRGKSATLIAPGQANAFNPSAIA